MSVSPQVRASRWCAWLLVQACICIVLAGIAQAGGGPENVLLVVNRRSWASISVANHYIGLRNLPSENVLYLDWPSAMEGTDIDTFRQQVLRPVLAAIERSGLDDHIDYVVYSSDFPCAIGGGGEMQALKLPNYLNPVGSLTGMTYLWPLVWGRHPDWVALNSNHYFRPVYATPGVPATHAFRSWYGWGNDGALLDAGGQHYMLSATLAVTSGRGNSLAEVVDYLTRSAQADGTSPKGTIYFDDTSDIRSQCRKPGFAAAVDELAQLGVRGEIVPDAIPRARPDVQGVMAGVADFSWPKSLSRILPGAICEHLTSTGGVLSNDAGQTPLTEWLRYGAAGSSGAVVEPYLVEAKFPTPQMHVHYARGSSLAEAYYQAIAAPYQLLIVGDPLCQPWARPPRITITGLEAGETVSGKRAIHAAVSPASADRVQWFLDGHRMAISTPGDRITLDSGTLADGYHQLRAVAVDNTDVETQGRAILPFMVDAQHRRVELTASTRSPQWDQTLTLSCQAAGAARIILAQQTRVLAQVAGEQASVEISPQLLGLGPVRLEALATYAGGRQPVRSVPLELNIGPGEFWPAVDLPPKAALVPGFDLVVGDGPSQVVQGMPAQDWITKYGGAAGVPFAIKGVFHVKTDDVYQFQLRYFGSIKCEVDGRQLFDGRKGDYSVQYIPVPLAAGLHRVRLFGTLGESPTLGLQFGNRGVQGIGPESFMRIVEP
ncbi:MAG TPA: hypothetical protein VHV55_08880 [Pirellulales bacterium]|nr:hypothetical protein [Pirellulales bacterium]